MRISATLFLMSILAVLVFSAGVLADFSYHGNNLADRFSTGEKISGRIDISFDEEPTDSAVTSNFPGEIELIDLLKANEFSIGGDYECDTVDCSTSYSSTSSVTGINIADEKLVGMVVRGNEINEISSAKFNVQSSLGRSCSPQLVVDILGDDENVFVNNKYTQNTCASPNYGCFKGDLPAGQYINAQISAGADFCNNVTLPPAPAYKLGARVTGSGGIFLELWKDGTVLGSCPAGSGTSQTQNLECIIPFSSSKSTSYLACVRAQDLSSDFTIRTETASPTCGSDDKSSFDRDYEVYAQGMEFDSASFSINDSEFSSAHGRTLANYLREFILDKYDGECEPECVIPIKLSGQSQTVTLSDAEIRYLDGQTPLIGQGIFNVNSRPAEITSGNLSIEISHANFTIPFGTREDDFELKIGGQRVFAKEINITQTYQFEINPRFVPFGQTVTFSADTDENITSSSWDFGDESAVKNSQGKSVQHRYLKQGEFSVEVELTRSDGVKSKKVFTIIVGEAKEIANTTLANYKTRASTLRSQLNGFEPWIKSEIESKVNLSRIDSSLLALETQYENATTDEQYEEIMVSLIGLKVPRSINTSTSGKLPLILGFENIDPSYITELSGGSVASQEEIRRKMSAWATDKLASEISFEHISALYDDGQEVIISKFKIDTMPRGQVDETHYLVINYPRQGIKFKQSYSEQSVRSGTVIELTPGSTNKVFEFSVLGEIGALELGAYISPGIDDLDSVPIVEECNYDGRCDEGENKSNCPGDCRPWGWFTFWIILIVFGALAIYIALQEWYKRYYENAIFPNENDLYNLINFIYNARKTGLSNREIRKKLAKAGWKGERINFAMKKIDGKRTGLYEIPIFKFIEKKKVRREIERRQSPGRRKVY